MSTELEHEAELSNIDPNTMPENAIAIIVLRNLLNDIRSWASTAQNARKAMMGNIISVPLSDEMIAISKAQERTLRGIEEEIVDRLKSAKIKFE